MTIELLMEGGERGILILFVKIVFTYGFFIYEVMVFSYVLLTIIDLFLTYETFCVEPFSEIKLSGDIFIQGCNIGVPFGLVNFQLTF